MYEFISDRPKGQRSKPVVVRLKTIIGLQMEADSRRLGTRETALCT